MNAYEQKQENRKQYYLEMAARKSSEASAAYNKAHQMAEVIPFGQPILVGHHSERSDRNYRNKISNTFDKAFETMKTVKYYEQKANSVGKSGISSDDPDAIKKLQKKLAGLEALQERMKAANKALRKNDVEALHTLGYSDSQISQLKKPDFCGRTGYPSYALTNNNANIHSTKERIANLEKMAIREPEIVEHEEKGYTYKEEDNRCQFIFDGKPSEEVRNILKSNAFKWSPSRGAWVRQLTGNGKRAAERVESKLQEVL